MSKAYICDRCGKIHSKITEDAIAMKPIWINNPYLYSLDERDGIATIHLCDECFADFKREYLENLREEGGVS